MRDYINQSALIEQNFRSRRDQIAIISDLLEIIKEPKRLTHILYKSNMSYGQLLKYLTDMTDLGLATEKKEPYRTYGISSNGKKFLEIVRKR